MTPEIEERLARLEGQVLGLQVALTAVILSLPDVAKAERYVALNRERFVASGLASAMPDEFFEAMEFAIRQCLPGAPAPGTPRSRP